MKKIIPILIVGIFFLSSFGAVAFKVEQEIDETRDFTHSVFAEYGTATWCGYCKYAHAALKKIYTSGDYPFNFVSLVCDKNPDASSRATEYNLYGYPTVWFDGGYKEERRRYSWYQAGIGRWNLGRIAVGSHCQSN